METNTHSVNATHTPGEWISYFNSDFEVHRIYAVTGNTSAMPVAELYIGATSEANARLIAAAPELLEVARKAATTTMLAMLNHEHAANLASDNGRPDEADGHLHSAIFLRDELAVVRAAIAKAEGKA